MKSSPAAMGLVQIIDKRFVNLDQRKFCPAQALDIGIACAVVIQRKPVSHAGQLLQPCHFLNLYFPFPRPVTGLMNPFSDISFIRAVLLVGFKPRTV
jgi:hypothetical protein